MKLKDLLNKIRTGNSKEKEEKPIEDRVSSAQESTASAERKQLMDHSISGEVTSISEQDLADQLIIKVQTLRNWRNKMDEGKHFIRAKSKGGKIYYTLLGQTIATEIKEKKMQIGDLKMVEPTPEQDPVYRVLFMKNAFNVRMIIGCLEGDRDKVVTVIVYKKFRPRYKKGITWLNTRHLGENHYTTIEVPRSQ